MSNRRKTRARRPDQTLGIPIDRGGYNLAVLGFRAVRECAACGGPARTVRAGSLLINHRGACPALKDLSLVMATPTSS